MSDPDPFDPTRQIYLLGRELYSALCIGNAPPASQEMAKRMRDPQVGDLVIEMTSFGGYDPDGVGWLRSLERNPDRPEIVDRYVVESLDEPGVEQGWQNAEFIALPTDRARRWLKEQR